MLPPRGTIDGVFLFVQRARDRHRAAGGGGEGGGKRTKKIGGFEEEAARTSPARTCN